MLVGYVRTTREGQIPAAEDAILREAGCELVFADPCVGTAAEQQPGLAKALESLQPQDVLLVTRLDRLAGGLRELITCMVEVQGRGAAVRTLQGAIEPGRTNGSALLEALLSFEKERAEARAHQRTRAVHDQTEQAARPRLLDDAAERLAASRAHADEPVLPIARSIGARRRRRTSASS